MGILFDGANIPADARDSGLFAGAGEMRARCRAFDWGATSVGPASTWSASVRTIVRMMLASRHPMFLWLGPDLIQIFNDGYLPCFGTSGRDVAALGARGREHWMEIWDIIGPQIDGVMTRGEATWHEDHFVPIERNGRLEDVYWTYGYSPVLDDDGTIRGTLVVCTETTRRVESVATLARLALAEREARRDADHAREAMTRVFAQAPVAIAVLEGRELRFTVANPSYRRTIGDRDPVGQTLLEVFPDLDGSDMVRLLTGVYDSAVPFSATDLFVRYDSQGAGQIDNYYDLVYHPLLTEQGVVRGIVIVGVDVTERRRALHERELLLAEADSARMRAELANRAKSDFLAMMSHEIRTPLNAIAGYAELVALGVHGPVTPEQAKALGRILQSERHLLGLVNGVLEYAKVDAGAVHYAVQDVRIDETLASCEALVIPQAREKGLTLRNEGCEGVIAARGDEPKVRQIVLNLLSNAVKFTDAGGIVTLTGMALDDGMVAVRVTDTGHGIAADQRERVFQPFVQLDARLTRTSEGTGLGLAISRDLARGMGGDLTVDSTPGVGSAFTLTLPAA